MKTAVTRQVVLASSSPYRRRLLSLLVDKFEICSPDIDETPLPGETPAALVERLAQAKAAAVAPYYPDALIIGSDQVASLEGRILGKPGNFAAALAQLQACSGKAVDFLTGLCLLDSRTKEADNAVETCTVGYRVASHEEMVRYLELEQPFDCAGAIKSEGLGIALLRYIRGDDPNTLVGLPLIRLGEMLRRRGYSPLLARHG